MPITVIPTEIPDVLIVEPRIHGDARGFFMESFNARDFRAATGVGLDFVQDNHSRSSHGVLRGMHYQIRHAQGKLVRATVGEIFDVAVDLRRSSPTFSKWVGVTLSADNNRQLWVPPGFAHGFLVLSGSADVQYKATNYWHPEHERGLRWDDETVGIAWPLANAPTLATKDAAASRLVEAESFD